MARLFTGRDGRVTRPTYLAAVGANVDWARASALAAARADPAPGPGRPEGSTPGSAPPPPANTEIAGRDERGNQVLHEPRRPEPVRAESDRAVSHVRARSGVFLVLTPSHAFMIGSSPATGEGPVTFWYRGDGPNGEGSHLCRHRNTLVEDPSNQLNDLVKSGCRLMQPPPHSSASSPFPSLGAASADGSQRRMALGSGRSPNTSLWRTDLHARIGAPASQSGWRRRGVAGHVVTGER